MNSHEQNSIPLINKWFEEKGKYFEERKEEIDTDYILELLDIAVDDLSASKLLFRRKFHAHSIYLLQQSVEKIGKSILLYEGYCSKEQLKKEIGHNASIYLIDKTIQIYDSLIEYSILRLNEETKKIIIWIKDFLLRYKEERKSGKTLHMDYQEAKKLLSYLIKIPSMIKRLKKIERKIQREMIKEDSKQAIAQAEIERIQEETKQPVEEEMRLKIEKSYDDFDISNLFTQLLIVPFLVIYSIVGFTILSMNLEIHSNATRYPDIISYYKYNKELDIVKLYPMMVKITGNVFKSFNKYLDLSSDNKLIMYFDEN